MNEEMPDEFWQGVEQFNAGQYYACHDTLEALWIEATEPEKTFYQGILQIAVALHHLSNRNLRGAAILLGEGSNRLRRYPLDYGGIDVDELLSQSAALLRALQHIEPEKIAALNLGQDKTLPLPRVIKVSQEKE
ncbi:hypothetical protein BZZ01_31310 [Nostocales cyanobacterium HT-58-2]|nr:hypothetical protein BZZ01_31310 [Nostocales cyanobacterium HT-58-2]